MSWKSDYKKKYFRAPKIATSRSDDIFHPIKFQNFDLAWGARYKMKKRVLKILVSEIGIAASDDVDV